MEASAYETAYAAKPWLEIRPSGGPAVLESACPTVLSSLARVAQRTPDAPAINYFDVAVTYGELDRLSDAFGAWLQDHGCQAGDRVMIILQNMPQFTIAALGTWKAGAVPTPSNPMYRERELRKLFADCIPSVVVCQNDHYLTVRAALEAEGIEAVVLSTCPRALQGRSDERVLPRSKPVPRGVVEFLSVLKDYEGARPNTPVIPPEGLALLAYTSGTTGVPKGAMISHRALAFNASLSARWFQMREGARLLTVAPLFHITGFVVHLAAALIVAGSTVLTYRFEPEVVLDALLEHRPNLMVAAITAYIALMNRPEAAASHFESFDALFTGGAPVPPSVVDEFAFRLGKPILTCYGMTETCAPTHIAPFGSCPPVDANSGALAIGIPVSNVDAKIVGEDGEAVAPGDPGELLVRGPQLMSGYWNKPGESAAALAGGWMHTGDVGFMDPQGWFYLVDRKKDMISASGFKVWPREVEDVLYAHAAVREAAVVGVPDPYRGETVKAYVSLKEDATTHSDALIAHCRERLAVYKAPRVVEILPELPKTVSGKIMRNALREQGLQRGADE